MATWYFVDWLLNWMLDTSEYKFEWDIGNSNKNVIKHGVTMDEIESVFHLGEALPLGEQITPIVSEQRLGVVGPSINNRRLQIAFVLREGRIRVISARPANKKERRLYEDTLRKVSKRI